VRAVGLSPTAAATGHSDDKSIPNPPSAHTNLCEPDSSGYSSFSLPVHDDCASGDRKIALPTHAMISGDESFPILDGRLHSRFARERHNGVQMIRHKQTEAAMPDESLVIKFHSASTPSPVPAWQSWFLASGTQLMVIKNQLPSAAHCGIVCGNFLRAGKSMR
jgi:hypothetical protein